MDLMARKTSSDSLEKSNLRTTREDGCRSQRANAMATAMSTTMSTATTTGDRRAGMATLHVGNLAPQTTERVLYELFLQAGPVASVYIPRDRVSRETQGYGFVDFAADRDADYAAQVLSMIRVHGQPIRISRAAPPGSRGSRLGDVGNDPGAVLHVGGLDPLVDDKLLHDTFAAFGRLARLPRVAVDDQGVSRGFAFLAFADFAAADAAIDAMDGQFLMNQRISVSYALRRDGQGERHGSAAERQLAQQAALLHGIEQSQSPAFHNVDHRHDLYDQSTTTTTASTTNAALAPVDFGVKMHPDRLRQQQHQDDHGRSTRHR